MKKLFVAGLIIGALAAGQLALAQTPDSPSWEPANNVSIVHTPNPVKKTVKEVAKKAPTKKLAQTKVTATKKTTKPVVQTKRPTKVVAAPVSQKRALPTTTAKPVARTAAPTTALAYGMYNPSAQFPGKRVALANSSAARANTYTSDDQTMAVPQMPSTVISTPTVTAKIKKEAKQETPSPWGLTVISYNAQDMNAMENTGATRDYTVRAWEQFYISYNFTPDISLTLNPQFSHTWFEDENRPQSTTNPGLNQSYAAWLMDTGLILKDTKIATLGGSGIVFGGFQSYYAPTSESSETAGELGETRTGLNLSKSLGKFDLKWQEAFRYYLQQYETNSFIGTDGKPLANVNYRVLSTLDATYNFTKALSFTLETGFINEAKYADSYNNSPAGYTDYFEMNPELDYAITKNFTLALGIWEVYNTTNQPQYGTGTVPGYTPFAPENGTTPGSWTASEGYLQGTLKF